MHDGSVRDVLQRAMAGEEPPISQGILGGAVRAARRARRRRLAAAVAAAAAVAPAVAFGVPAVAGALAPATQLMHHQGPPLAGRVPATGASPSPSTPDASMGMTGPMFVTPTLPPANPEQNPVPITAQALGQLLIDDLPAGAQPSQIEAAVSPAGSQPGQAPTAVETAQASFNVVTTPAGSGLVDASMMAVGPSPVDFGCAGLDPGRCREYSLPGGILVDEEYMGLFFVNVFRPGVAELTISEADTAAAAGSTTTKGMPLTAEQMLTIALDSRWQWTASQSFVQQASHLSVAPISAAGS